MWENAECRLYLMIFPVMAYYNKVEKLKARRVAGAGPVVLSKMALRARRAGAKRRRARARLNLPRPRVLQLRLFGYVIAGDACCH